jgi:hypothetical protein
VGSTKVSNKSTPLYAIAVVHHTHIILWLMPQSGKKIIFKKLQICYENQSNPTSPEHGSRSLLHVLLRHLENYNYECAS